MTNRPARRIVSLLPSTTEIVDRLGLGERLVGVTFECDWPANARRDCTVVVGGRDTSELTPAQIDAYVRDTRAAGGDLYTLRADALAALDPDLILTQDLCRVCALPSGQVDEALRHLGCSAEVLSIDPYSLEDVLDSILTIGYACGTPDVAAAQVGALRNRLDAVAEAVRGRPRPRVCVVEWVDPLFCGGHWIPDLVVAAGGEPVAMSPRRPSRATDWSALAEARPDVVVVAPCGFGLDGAAEQARTVASVVPRTAAVWAMDGDALVVRPGPRVVDGVETLAGILHPGRARIDDGPRTSRCVPLPR